MVGSAPQRRHDARPPTKMPPRHESRQNPRSLRPRGLQLTVGKGICPTVALCTLGVPLLARGTGNAGGGDRNYFGGLG